MRLADIARVEDGFKENTNEVRADYGEGVMLLISKQSDANTIITSRKIKEALPEMLAALPESFVAHKGTYWRMAFGFLQPLDQWRHNRRYLRSIASTRLVAIT